MRPTRAQLAARLEDVRWMAETGECLDGAARRLGLSRNTLEKFLERNDRDSLARLIARQPRDHNRFVDVGGPSIYELTGHGANDHRARKQRQEVAA